MRKILSIFRNEFINVVSRWSFILMLFGLPLIGFAVVLVVSLINQGGPLEGVGELFSSSQQEIVEGYVDLSGIITEINDDYLQSRLKSYATEEQARLALDTGDLDAYYIIAPDYLQTGKISLVRSDFNPLEGMDQSWAIERVLRNNLLADETVAERTNNPMNLEMIKVNLNASGEVGDQGQALRNPDNPMTFFLPYGVTMLFYIVIMGSASLMLNSVTSEKQNRVMEILMSSVTPIQILSGKMSALGLVGLLQTFVWSGTGWLLLRLSGRQFNIPDAFQLPPEILLWGVVFFLLGYVVYASLMAGVGALVPNLKDASQATFIMILPLIIPMMLISNLINNPNGTLAVVLSIFPLTAPVVMMTRLAAFQVPLWQLLTAVVILLATAYLILRGVAGMFRAQTLLGGQTFSLKLFIRSLLGSV